MIKNEKVHKRSFKALQRNLLTVLPTLYFSYITNFFQQKFKVSLIRDRSLSVTVLKYDKHQYLWKNKFMKKQLKLNFYLFVGWQEANDISKVWLSCNKKFCQKNGSLKSCDQTLVYKRVIKKRKVIYFKYQKKLKVFE